MQKVPLLFIYLIVSVIRTFGQLDNNPLIVQPIINQSPEANSLGRYGEVGVGEFTGTPDITVPLHVIKSGKVEYPLSLNYNATGIKVNQEATWIGLGWDLSTTAGITYIAAGGNDQLVIVDPPWSEWEKLINYINPIHSGPTAGGEDIEGSVDCSLNIGGNYSSLTPATVVRSAIAGKGDRDMYSVNCLGFSFKFYIHPGTNRPKIYGDKNNFLIEQVGNTGFLITDGKGVKYYFLAQEGTSYLHEITNWFLTEIRMPDGDWLKFKYQNFGLLKMIPGLSEQRVVLGGGIPAQTSSPNNRNISSSYLQNLYLTEIESMTEVVTFHLSNNRLDLAGEGARRLDRITVVDKFSSVTKNFEFQYGYFDGSNVGGDYLNDDDFTKNYITPGLGLSQNHIKKRLKLLSVAEKDAGLLENRKYSFEYDEEHLLPGKTSFAMDHWGNYNGQENVSNLLNYSNAGHTIAPKLFSVLLYDPTYKNKLIQKDLVNGANRGASDSYIRTATLKSITYPTGGKTLFTFEPHHFNNVNLLSAEEEKVGAQGQYVNVFDLNYSDGSAEQYTQASFTLTSETVVSFMGHINNKNGEFNCNQMASTYINLMSVPSVSVVKSWNFNCMDMTQSGVYAKVWEENIILPAGSYVLICGLNGSLGFQGYFPLVTANIRYTDHAAIETVLNSHHAIGSIGGGLRISKIQNFNSDNTLLTSKEFRYVNDDGSTSGKLTMPLKYLLATNYTGKTSDCTNLDGGGGEVILLKSNNALSLSTSPIRAIVGYDRVEIIDKGTKAQANNGKVVKTFSNTDPFNTFFDDIIMNDASSIGDLKSIAYLNDQGNSLRTETYDYEIRELDRDFINVKVKNFHAGTFNCNCNWPIQGPTYLIGVYPYINYKKLMTKKVEEEIFSGGVITQQSDFNYSPTSYQLTQTTTKDSKQDVYITKKRYPQDLTLESSIYSVMKNANMVDHVVEEIVLRNDEQLSKVKTNYSLVDNYLIKPVTVEQQIKNNSSVTNIVYGRYSNGNVSQYKTSDNIDHSYIWGYNQTLPIAKVDNSILNNVFFTGFEDVDGNSDESKTGRKSRSGGYSKSLINLANGSYTLTYWLKSVSAWILQTSTVVVASNSYTISFTSSQQVDDIRFYPQNASMSTYTYDPLFGITSSTDENNIITFFEYDSFGRLELIKDKDDKVIKKYQYHFRDKE